MFDSILCVIRTYQTLVTGLLGFSGVIVTLSVNAWLQRLQHQTKIEHDRSALRLALRAELNINKQTYDLRIGDLKNTPEHKHALIPTKIMNEVYETLLGTIGLLSDMEIEKVINAYLLIAEIPYRLKLLVGTDNIGGTESEFIRLREEHMDVARKIHESILPKITEAIESINAHITNRA